MIRFSSIRMPALVVIFMASVLSATGQNKHENLLAAPKKLLKQAQDNNADLFSPVNYDKGSNYYKQSEEDLADGKDPEDVQGTLDEAVKYLTKAIEVSGRAEVVFAPIMKARADVMRVNGPELYPTPWRNAESGFREIAGDFEDGDTESAAQEVAEVEALYRAIELDAIRTRFLASVDELLKRADDSGAKSVAPKTLQKAQALAKQAEDIINQNRYDSVNALQTARQARYEAAHALHLQSLISRMQKEDKTSEDLVLMGEEPLQEIAAYLNVPAQFDTDYAVTVAHISTAIENLRAESLQSADTIKRLEWELVAAKQRIALMETRLTSLSELERNVRLQKEQDDLLTNIRSTFTDQEAAVVRGENTVVIQLFGLVFPAGKSIIEPQYFGLLSKVRDAINRIPTKDVSIEGHTEPGGSEQTAQKLSESRADAVSQYLKANIGKEDIQITSKGFGKMHPMASKDSPDGKTRNCRLEIVITPDWAGQSK